MNTNLSALGSHANFPKYSDQARAEEQSLLLTFDWDIEADAFKVVPPSPILSGKRATSQKATDDRYLICAVDLFQIRSIAERNTELPIEFFRAMCTVHLPDEKNELAVANYTALKGPRGQLTRIVGNIKHLSGDFIDEHQFNIATATTSDVVFLLDFQSNRHWWSSSFLENFGHRPLQGENVLSEWKKLVHPDDLTGVENSHSTARLSGAQTWQYEYRFCKADGTYANVIDRARFFRDENGKILRSISSLIDVTALRQSEERFHRATAAAADTLYTWDIKPNRAWRSDSFYKKYGYSKVEFHGDPGRWLEIIHPSDRERVLRERETHANSTRTYWEIVYRLKHMDGRYFNVVDRSFAIRDSNNSLLKVSGSIVDVTELVREGERFKTLAEVTGSTTFEYDVETETMTIGSGIKDVFGHTWVGTFPTPSPWQEAIHPEDRNGVVQKFDAFAVSADRNWNCTYRMVRADGSWARVRERGIALREESGGMRRVIGTVEDVTEEHEAEEKSRHMERLESLGKLTGGVAHDFNNLLTVITASAELLTSLPETTREQVPLLDAIKLAAGRGADLTSSLLSFSRKKPLEPKTLDVGVVVGEIADLLRRTLPAFIKLNYTVDPHNWAIEADPTQINTALLNLIVNSADSMPTGGEIVIEAKCLRAEDVTLENISELRPIDYVRITVIDGGMGMTTEVLRRACDPFFTTKEIGKGSGLGLSMVWGFVQQSGGQMVVRSKPLEGTSVSLYLPRSIAIPLHYKVSKMDTGLVRGDGEFVLVVEDDDMLRPQVVSMIRALNYSVFAVESGDEALNYIRGGAEVDLIFTDLIMPGEVSGKDLMDEVHQKYEGIRVLLTSGYADEAIVGKTSVDESVSFLAKPYKMKDLSEKLYQLLS